VAVPGNGEEDAAVAGAWHHDGGVRAQERSLEDEMDSLAGTDHLLRRPGRSCGEWIGEDAGGVDDDAREYLKVFAALFIEEDYAVAKPSSSLLISNYGA
jgi:hypothetical protein